jgi:hypothetical protein
LGDEYNRWEGRYARRNISSAGAELFPGQVQIAAAGVGPGGLLIIQGYTPKQLAYGTGGPKEVDKLYTRPLLGEAFAGFQDMVFTEGELELHEGTSHGGMSAVIGLTCRKPQ